MMEGFVLLLMYEKKLMMEGFVLFCFCFFFFTVVFGSYYKAHNRYIPFHTFFSAKVFVRLLYDGI